MNSNNTIIIILSVIVGFLVGIIAIILISAKITIDAGKTAIENTNSQWETIETGREE